MDFSELSKVSKDALSEKLAELSEHIDAATGETHDIVLLLHKKHPKGEGQCAGVAILSAAELGQIANILNQGLMLTAATFEAHMPSPGTAIN